MNKYDIIIIGNGVVGSALACALGEANLQVLLLDSQPSSTHPQPEQDLRVSSITYSCQQWLANLGIWAEMPKKYLGAFRTMHVWEQPEKDSKASMHFNSAALGIPALGYIVPNQLLLNAIQKKLKTLSDIEVLQPVQAESLHFTRDNVFINTNDQQLCAKLLIGADGAQSWVRQQCQFEIIEKPYDHMALMAHIHHQKNHQECARQRFSGNDILAFLPLADPYRSALVWSGEPKHIQELKELPTEDFTTALQKVWGDELGALTTTSARVAFPLIERHTLNYIQDRVALIGDAAHTLHPLAGQGLNLGLWDAQSLAEIIVTARKNLRDIGRYSNLRRFERSRHWQNQLMLDFVAANKWLFSQTSPSISTFRQIGMHTLDKLALIKRKISHFAVFAK